ncbi:MAG TPA: hypothetical protein VMS96_07800 [Terriglobales bacterium]|nr:hypothetical protein [Terriglobales bacterium]
MIFGFNTDVKYGDTVYHVQSEARANDLLLQTQVFVKGHCIGKRAASYAHHVTRPGFSEENMHEMLKAQHRLVLDAVKEGKVEGIIDMKNEIQDVDGRGLSLRWTNPDVVLEGRTVTMKFTVADNGTPIAGAVVRSRPFLPQEADLAARGTTDASGALELGVTLDEHGLKDGAVIIQASYGDKSATRKFRMKKGSSAGG